MSNNRSDFDFDDDIFGDENGGFEFPEDEQLPDVFGTGMEEMPSLEEEPDRGGPNRVFIILAVLMILLFIGGLALVFVLITRETGPTDVERTSTQIALLNATVEAQLAATQTQAVFVQQTQAAEIAIAQTGTRAAEFLTLTAAAFTDTPSPTFTPSPSATLDPTQLALTDIALTDVALTAISGALAETATAVAAQAIEASPTPEVFVTATFTPEPAVTVIVVTVEGATVTPEPPTPEPPTPTIEATSPLFAINQTATAIAEAFLEATRQAGGVPATPEGPQPTPGFPTLAPSPTALPETGLFDDLASGGSSGLGLLAIAIVGLVGVIVLARGLRVRVDQEANEEIEGGSKPE